MPDQIGFVSQLIKKLLIEDANIAALVGARIYCPKAPESNSTWPIVVYRSTFPFLRDELLEAPGTSGLSRERIRTLSAVKTLGEYETVKKLDRFVNDALKGQRGIITVAPGVVVDCRGIFQHTVSGIDNPEDRPDVISVVSDFDVWFAER